MYLLCSKIPFCSNRKRLLLLMVLWKSCPMLKYMSTLHECYWPSEIFISGLQIVECPILVPFFPCLPLLLLTLFSIPRPRVSLIEVEPISPYTVSTHSVLCCSLLCLSLFTGTFLAPTNICKHTHTLTHSHTHTHTNLAIPYHWRTLFHTGRQTTSHRGCAHLVLTSFLCDSWSLNGSECVHARNDN